jgi:predicted membrane channel-forming protein YqfA (hemolysin III family)
VVAGKDGPMSKLIVPIVVFILLLGAGTYLTSVVLPLDDHEAKVFLMICVTLGATFIYSVLAYRAGVFKRPKS